MIQFIAQLDQLAKLWKLFYLTSISKTGTTLFYIITLILPAWALPHLENKRPFQVNGEELKFEVSYLGIVGGYSSFKTTPIPSKKVIKFEVRAYTIPWVEKIFRLRLYMTSYSDERNFQTIQYSESRQENKRYYYNIQRFFIPEKYYIFSDKRGLEEERVVKVSYTNDGGISVIGAFHYGRTTGMEIGKTYFLTCFFKDGDPRPIGIKILRKEKINTLWGEKNTIVITPEMNFDGFLSDQKKMEIYISNDLYRIPLAVDTILKFGTIKAKLIDGYPGEKVDI